MGNSHNDAIAANLEEFSADFATWYDGLDTTKALSLLFSKILLEFDINRKRKTLEESSKVLGNPDPKMEAIGFNMADSLPNIDEFKTKYPHSLFKPGIKILDFACGTGIVTQYLAPYLEDKEEKSEIVGIDISEGLLKTFDRRAKKMEKFEGVSVESCQADILDPNFDHDYEGQFDVIYSTIAYHHIENYQEATKKLVSYLRPGGWLFIIDFYNEDVESTERDPPVTASVRHMGGLKIDTLNHTLEEYSHLTNVSSAREIRTFVWEPAPFIESHSTTEYIEKLHSNSLRSKKGTNGEDLYLIEASIILAIGQKPL